MSFFSLIQLFIIWLYTDSWLKLNSFISLSTHIALTSPMRSSFPILCECEPPPRSGIVFRISVYFDELQRTGHPVTFLNFKVHSSIMEFLFYYLFDNFLPSLFSKSLEYLLLGPLISYIDSPGCLSLFKKNLFWSVLLPKKCHLLCFPNIPLIKTNVNHLHLNV